MIFRTLKMDKGRAWELIELLGSNYRIGNALTTRGKAVDQWVSWHKGRFQNCMHDTESYLWKEIMEKYKLKFLNCHKVLNIQTELVVRDCISSEGQYRRLAMLSSGLVWLNYFSPVSTLAFPGFLLPKGFFYKSCWNFQDCSCKIYVEPQNMAVVSYALHLSCGG